jgi:NADH-quinone oxidoreductase subunit E
MFKREPQGKLLVSVCTSVSCLVNGGPELLDHLARRYADDPDVTVEEVECLAASDGAPVMQVNYEFHERMTPSEAERIVEAYKSGQLTARGPSGARRPAPGGPGVSPEVTEAGHSRG